MTDFADWLLSGGAGATATIAGFVSTVVSLCSLAWNRRRVHWGISGHVGLSQRTETHPDVKAVVFLKLWNLGDLDAFDVSVTHRGRAAHTNWDMFADSPDPKGLDPLRVEYPSLPIIRSGAAGEFVVVLFLDKWDEEKLVVRWRTPPLWRWRLKRRELKLGRIVRTPRERPIEAEHALPASERETPVTP